MKQERASYPTDVSDAQWNVLVSVLVVKSGAGRPLQHELREIINAILYVVRGGIARRSLPHDFPKWSTVYYHFRRWCLNGAWQQLNSALCQQERLVHGRNKEASGVILDSQSAKTTQVGGERGYDAGKQINGRKRHIAVDTRGSLLAVVVNAADGQDRNGAKLTLSKLTPTALAAIRKLWADGSYREPEFLEWLQQKINPEIVLEIAYRPPNAGCSRSLDC